MNDRDGGAALRACLSGIAAPGGAPPLDPALLPRDAAGWARLLDEAARHGLDALLRRRLLALPPGAVPAAVLASAAAATAASDRAGRRLVGALLAAVGALEDAGVRPLALKGPAMAALAWGDPFFRPPGDLDLLVPEAEAAAARAALARLGFRPGPAAPRLARAVHLWRADGVMVDLHWNVVGRQLPFPLDPAALRARALPVALPGGAVALPPAEWLLVLSAVYLVKDWPEVRLGSLADVAGSLARCPGLDGRAVAAVAHATGTRRLVAFALDLREAVTGLPWPSALAAHLPRDPVAAGMAAAVAARLLAPAPERWSGRLGWLVQLRGQAALRERARDRWMMRLALVPLALLPGPGDAALAGRLGGGAGLAALLRPFRLGRDLTHAGLERLRRLETMLHGRALPRLAGLGLARPRPAAGVSLHLVDGEGLLLNAASQELWALSNTAAYLWCCLEEGMDLPEATRAYARAYGLVPAAARAQAQGLVAEWWRIGLLAGAPPRRPAEPPDEDAFALPAPPGPSPAHVRRFRVLDTVFRLGFPDPGSLEPVAAVLAPFALPAPAPGEAAPAPDEIAVELRPEPDGLALVVDGSYAEPAMAADEAAPLVKAELVARAVARYPFALDLHAAVLARGQACLLLPAAPGSGKTVLTAALARTGFAYRSDEVAILEPESLAARGVPLAMAVKAGGWPVLAPLYPELPSLPVHRRADGRAVRYLPPPVRPGDPALDRHYPVRWIVLPSYRPGRPAALTPLPRVEALRRLLAECLALRLKLDAATLDRLAAWLRGIRTFELVGGDLATAVCLLDELCREDAPAEAGGVVRDG